MESEVYFKIKGVKVLENNFICVENQPVGGKTCQVVNDVLLEVVARVLAELGATNAAGTFILDGQPYGGEAQCILRFNLSNSGFGLRRFFRQTGHTCTEVAEASIDEILEIEDESLHYFNGCEMLQKARLGATVSSWVYQNDVWQVLVLNASYGRFLCSVCMNDDMGYDSKTAATSILHAVGTALGLLSREDSTLLESSCIVNCPTGLGDTVANRQHRRVISLVKALFEDDDNEVVQKWRTWRQEAEKSGELKMFFQ